VFKVTNRRSARTMPRVVGPSSRSAGAQKDRFAAGTSLQSSYALPSTGPVTLIAARSIQFVAAHKVAIRLLQKTLNALTPRMANASCAAGDTYGVT
jgi:hypothetical protein